MTEDRPEAIRLRRSALYLPGSNARAIEKARTLDTDAIILDLEDAVSPERKNEARARVREALKAGGFAPRECVVRVNGLDTPWCAADLAAFADVPLDGILFPKVNRAADMDQIAAAMREAGVDPSVSLWVMAETPLCILNIRDICLAGPAPSCVVVGTSDLARDMRVPHTPGRLGLLPALSACVMAARAAGADVLDGVHLALDDSKGLEKACEQGRNLGFDGKTLIHPSQIGAANRAFSPSASALENARRVMAAWREAEASGSGVVVVDGRLVERLHAEEAGRILALQRQIESRARRG